MPDGVNNQILADRSPKTAFPVGSLVLLVTMVDVRTVALTKLFAITVGIWFD